MICSIGRAMRAGAVMRRPGSWRRWSGRWTGWPAWGCSMPPSAVSWGGCAIVRVARARRLAAPRRRGPRTAEMVGRRQHEAGWPALLAGAVLAVWGWRLELALAALLVLAQRLLASALGDIAACVVVVVLV